MDNVGGTITWVLDVESKKFGAALSKASRDVKNLASSTEGQFNKLGDNIKGSMNNLAATGLIWAKRMSKIGAVAAVGFGLFGLKTAGDLESARQGFVTLLGSAQKADAVIAQIKTDAAKTPFELKGLIQANEALTAVTKNGGQSEQILMNVGKALAAAGKGQPELDRIIANLQQIGLTGKITELDIRQFGMSGINILELLASYYGTTTAKAGEMVKNSKHGFEDLQGAFAKAGGAGGQFANAFKNQAGTFNQLVSNMKDSITIFASDFVRQTGIFDVAKRAIQGFTVAVTSNKTAIIDSIINGFNNLVAVIRRIISVVRTVAGYFMTLFWPSIKALVSALQPLLASLRSLYTALQPALIKVLKIVAIIIGVTVYAALWLLINAIRVAVKVLASLIGAFAQVIRWAGNVVAVIINAARKIGGAFVGVQSRLIAPFRAAFNWIMGQINRLLGAIARIKSAVNSITRAPQRAFGGITGWLSHLPGFATGGIVTKPTLAMVGESGAEAIVPLKDMNKITTGGGSGVTNHIGTINITSDVDGEKWLKRLTRDSEVVSKGMVNGNY